MREEAHRLFAQLSKDLVHVTADFPNKILCPLCLGPFSEDGIDLDDPEITIEHIIPERLGGKTLTTLTCKKTCNNRHGSKLESHLIQMLRCQDSLSGIGSYPVPGWIDVEGTRLPVDMSLSSGTSEVSFVGRPFNPHAVAKVSDALRNKTADSIGVTLNAGFIPNRANVALVRIAYLAMFQRGGYRYILSPAVDLIRRSIARFEDPPDELSYPMVIGFRNVLPQPPKRLQIHCVEEGAAYSVLIVLTADAPRYFVVIMPDPRLRPNEVFRALRQAGEAVVSRCKTGSSAAG